MSPEINHLRKDRNNNLNYLSWKTGKLQFVEASIFTVCNDISKLYNVSIIINGEPDKEIALTSSFNNKTLDEILELIELTLDVKFIKTDEKIELNF